MRCSLTWYAQVGFFNSVARGENWVWQTVMPTYAQATAMAVNSLFRSSNLMVGDMPLPKLGCYTLGFEQLRTNQSLLAQCSETISPECGNQNIVGEGEQCQAPDSGGWHPPVLQIAIYMLFWNFFGNFLSKMQKEWRIAPENR